MKSTRTLACIATGYIGVLAFYVIAQHFCWIYPSTFDAFAMGGLTVGFATTLAALSDRILINRRLVRMTAPMAQQVRQDFEALGRSPRAILG